MADYEATNDFQKEDSASTSVPLMDIVYLTLNKWQWIVLSVLICVGLATAYLLRTPTVYTRSAEILIKDESKGKSAGMEEFASLGLFQTNMNIQNEVTNLSAKDLMADVVKRLNLDMNYYVDGRFHKDVAYGYGLPVKLTVSNFPAEQSFKLDLKVSPKGEVTIKDIEVAGADKFIETFSGRLNDSITTPIGKMVVTPTHSYVNEDGIEMEVFKQTLELAIKSYHSRLNVSLVNDKGTVIKLLMADQSIQRADEVLSTLINIYNENWIRDKNQIAVSTSNFINDRLGVIEGELGNVDSDISSYKSENLIPDVQAAASMYMTQSQQTQSQILDVNNQLSMARYIKSYLSTDGNREQLLPANTGLQNSSIQTLIGEYNERQLHRNSLIAKSSDKNPLVAQLDEQLAAQRRAIVNTIDNEIIALNTQLKALRSSEAQTISRIASNPTQAKNLLSVERQQKVKESLYLFLLQKREDNELSQAFTAYNTRIINKPGPSDVPPKPKRSLILAVAFLFGLAIPFGINYLKEMTNTKIRGRKDIEHVSVPFLGEIPLNGESKDGEEGKKITVKAGKRDIINEAFRVLRTNVEFMTSSVGRTPVVEITSFNPGSGKSFISVNLAMTIAIKNKRVLVIDGDMRHGSTSAYVGSPDQGMSNYLSGSINDINSVIVNDEHCNTLFFLPCGTLPPNPAELLESKRFPEMLEKLKENYDLIIVDCPPIEVVADAQIIDQYADLTFFIVRAGLLERSMVPELDRLYNSKKFKNMALILNGTKNEQNRFGNSRSYRYGYGYGYGYGYHYGSDAKNKKKTN